MADLPQWLQELEYGQALARYSAGQISPETWLQYQDQWKSTWGKYPETASKHGRPAVDLYKTASGKERKKSDRTGQ